MNTIGQLEVKVKVLEPGDSPGKAAEAVRASAVGAAPVVADGVLVGLVTSAALAQAMEALGPERARAATLADVELERAVAMPAGLSAGDRLVAVDGLRCDEATLKAILMRRAPGSAVRVHAFRRDELVETTLTLAPARPAITLVASARNAQRDAWLASLRTSD